MKEVLNVLRSSRARQPQSAGTFRKVRTPIAWSSVPLWFFWELIKVAPNVIGHPIELLSNLVIMILVVLCNLNSAKHYSDSCKMHATKATKSSKFWSFKPSDSISLNTKRELVSRGRIELSTRGFSVDVLINSLIKSMCCKC